MTTIIIRKTNTNQYHSFTCMGHANYAKFFQKDIVCASISVLVINTINAIDSLTEEAGTLEVTTNDQTGFIQCKFTKVLSEQSNLLMDAMVLGIESIEQQYSKK